MTEKLGDVKAIEFKLLSPQMIKEMATVEITIPELYDTDGFPIEGGLSDLRLGVIDPGLRCRVCGGKIGQCFGHFGYVQLVKPVINPLFAPKIYQLLKLTCRKCGRLLVEEEELKKGKKLSDVLKKVAKKCKYCGTEQKEIIYEKPTTFREGNKKLNPEEIRERLERIRDEDLPLLRLKGGRPEWMIITILPVPPVTVRPSITLETGGRSEDDLTHKLVDIVRINERLKRNLELGAPEFIIDDIWELLQYHVTTYIDNEIGNIPPARHRSGRALKTLVQRLQKKEGRFRGNLTGKRVNFSARTVIAPDTMISINEVGVPLEIAKELTVAERVTQFNLEELRRYVLNGETYPGANYIVRPDGVRKRITEENKEELAKELAPGYLVERHLIDGDIVIFNRQPSLHRMSMMAHRVRVIPYRTFTLNLCATIPYNADFDGDEMNLHVPQTEEARVEAELLMLVEKNIRSPRYGAPIIACKHDHISGCYLLSKEEKLPKEKVVRLLAHALGYDWVLEHSDELKESMSGKEVISLLLPKELNIEFKASCCVGCARCKKEDCEYDAYVVIKNGKLVKGVIDEAALGEKKGKLLNRIEKQFGCARAREFLDAISKLALHYITERGFSISISECDISKGSIEQMKKIYRELSEEAKRVAQQIKDEEERDRTLLRMANEIVNRCSEIVKRSTPENNIVHMIRSGARGSYVSLTQISGLVGQKVLMGELIKRGYSQRTTSHFERGEHSLEAHGFVASGYKEGLDPIGFFFDAAASRENLMDKSLQTRHSGYMERRLVNALQDVKVEADYTVRDSRGVIIQFAPGEDFVDPAKSEVGRVNLELEVEA